MTTTEREEVEQVAKAIGSSLMPDNAQWTNRFTIDSLTSSAVYTVAQRRTDGVWGCSCRGWIHHRRCKHLTDILHRLAVVAAGALGVRNAAVLKMLASARTAYLDLEGNKALNVAHPAVLGRQVDL